MKITVESESQRFSPDNSRIPTTFDLDLHTKVSLCQRQPVTIISTHPLNLWFEGTDNQPTVTGGRLEFSSRIHQGQHQIVVRPSPHSQVSFRLGGPEGKMLTITSR